MTVDSKCDLKRRHFRDNVLLSYKEHAEGFSKEPAEGCRAVVVVMLDGEVLGGESYGHFQVIWTRPRDCDEAVPVVDYDGVCKAAGSRVKAFGVVHRNWSPDYRTPVTFPKAFRSFCIK
jgi:hypothetical protein